jgi:dTDP-4-dehydrorhamnose reductase
MQRLKNERDELRVVNDQVGTPTWAFGLAQTIWAFRDHPEAHGVYHWTDAGSCSWYDFASAIYTQGRELGLIEREVRLEAIPTSEYPTAAQRPAYSVLDCSSTHSLLDTQAVDWQSQLQAMLRELQA